MNTNALAGAWLDAFRRAQSEFVQRLAAQLPQNGRSGSERSLTDVIESAVKSGGAGPQQVQPAADAGSARRLDVRA